MIHLPTHDRRWTFFFKWGERKKRLLRYSEWSWWEASRTRTLHHEQKGSAHLKVNIIVGKRASIMNSLSNSVWFIMQNMMMTSTSRSKDLFPPQQTNENTKNSLIKMISRREAQLYYRKVFILWNSVGITLAAFDGYSFLRPVSMTDSKYIIDRTRGRQLSNWTPGAPSPLPPGYLYLL